MNCSEKETGDNREMYAHVFVQENMFFVLTDRCGLTKFFPLFFKGL